MLGKYWDMLPTAAKRYIVYHVIVAPLLFAWWIVPYLMLTSGLTVFEAGILYSVAQGAAAALTFLAGRLLDRYSPNVMISLVSVVEAASYVLYYFAFHARSPLLVLLGLVVERGSAIFYPAFSVYEHAAYPEEIREKAFAYHNILPFLSQAATFPLAGYLLGVAFTGVKNLTMALLLVALLDVLTAIYPLKLLPWMQPPPSEGGKKRAFQIPRGFLFITLTHTLFLFADQMRPMIVFVDLLREVFGGGLFEIGVYEAIYGLFFVVSTLPVLRIGREKGLSMVLAGLSLVSAGDAMLAFTNDIHCLFLAAALSSAGGALMSPYYMDILFSNIPDEVRGTLLGSLSAIGKLLRIVTPALAGFIALTSPQLPYLVSLLTGLAGVPTLILAAKGVRTTG